ncbi:unnamed protein product [Pylaiella littoralis]
MCRESLLYHLEMGRWGGKKERRVEGGLRTEDRAAAQNSAVASPATVGSSGGFGKSAQQHGYRTSLSTRAKMPIEAESWPDSRWRSHLCRFARQMCDHRCLLGTRGARGISRVFVPYGAHTRRSRKRPRHGSRTPSTGVRVLLGERRHRHHGIRRSFSAGYAATVAPSARAMLGVKDVCSSHTVPIRAVPASVPVMEDKLFLREGLGCCFGREGNATTVFEEITPSTRGRFSRRRCTVVTRGQNTRTHGGEGPPQWCCVAQGRVPAHNPRQAGPI